VNPPKPQSSIDFGPEALQARARERVGQVLCKKWRLDALLGAGSFGAAYAASHRTGSVAAVKILHRHLAFNEKIRARFLREAYLANKVHHHGAVTVLDDDADEEGIPFLVMELLEGLTLEQRGAHMRFRMDPREALWVADRVLDVLSAAHAQGIVHRDIKPDNIFITSDRRVKLLDFGIARLAELSHTQGLSALGMPMGTPSFMAPEQARGEWDLVDGRADLFAVGATLYAVLTGHRLFSWKKGDGLTAAMFDRAPPLATVVRELGPAIAAFVDRALSFEREGRYPDARAMQLALHTVYTALTGVSLPPADWSHGAGSGPPTRRPSALPGTPVEVEAGKLGDELTSCEPGPNSGCEFAAEPSTQPLGLSADGERVVSRAELANAYLYRGLRKHGVQNLVGAIADYTRAIDLIPLHAIAYFNRGVARQARGELDEALLDYGSAIDRQTEFADPYYNRACILFARGDLFRAGTDAARALELYRRFGREAAIEAAAALLDDITKRSHRSPLPGTRAACDV
jgi:serine/threonine protein kinase